MRMILAAAALIAAGAAPVAAFAAAPNDIIWDPPKPAASAPAANAPSKETLTPLAPSTQGAPDRNGIIWNEPSSSSPSPSSAAAAPPPSSGKPDGNGIVWNAPPVRPSGAPPSGPLLTPPSGPSQGARLAQAPVTDGPVTDGPCREFQTTIVIDGKREPAHGTVCQQPDGTWRVVNK